MVSHWGFAFIFLMSSEVGHFSHVFISIHMLCLTKCLNLLPILACLFVLLSFRVTQNCCESSFYFLDMSFIRSMVCKCLLSVSCL